MFGTANKSNNPVGETYQASRIRLKDAWEEYKNRSRGEKKDEIEKSLKIQPMKALEEYKNNNREEKKEREKSPKIKSKKPPSLVKGAKGGGEYDRGGMTRKMENKKVKKAKKGKKT